MRYGMAGTDAKGDNEMAKERTRTRAKALLLAGLLLAAATPAPAAPAPTPQQMLSYKPRQDVAVTTPTAEALAACKVELVKGRAKGSGWVLKDGAGQTLRVIFDSADRGTPDVFSYFKDGVEVYRETDTTYAGKPDQY